MKKKLIVLGICLLMISVIFSSGCISDNKTKDDFLWSHYYVYIFSASVLPQVEISIPFPTASITKEDLNNSLYRKKEGIALYDKDEIYGNRIQLPVGSRTYWNWAFDKEIVNTNFSNQEDNHIWIYLNKTNNRDRIYIFLDKEDCWNTPSRSTTITDYVGLMNNSLPKEFTSREHDEFIPIDISIELMDGWHKYPLTQGTYYVESD